MAYIPNLFGPGIREGLSWVVLAQELSHGCSQKVAPARKAAGTQPLGAGQTSLMLSIKLRELSVWSLDWS